MSVIQIQKRIERRINEIQKLVGMIRERHMYKVVSKDREWPQVFKIDEKDVETKGIFQELKLDPDDPVHWRALIEAFTRAYAPKDGRPERWTSEAKIDLGFDILKIVEGLPAKERTVSGVCKLLQKNIERYETIGHDRLRKLVTQIVGKIRPIDDRILPNLKKMNPDYFFEKYLGPSPEKKALTPAPE